MTAEDDPSDAASSSGDGAHDGANEDPPRTGADGDPTVPEGAGTWAPLAPFDGDVLDATADDHGVDPGHLRDVLRRHQSFVREYEAVGGTDGLVYEWRQSFPSDPVVEQAADRYYLVVDERVWGDFRRRLELDATVFDALRAVHAAQFERDVGAASGVHPMVLVRG
ncbi:MAG: hypothetical protein ABEJ42_02985 [Halobacteriaceae archaeon]